MSKQFLFGLHALKSLLEKHPERILQLYVQEGRVDQKVQNLLHLAGSQRIKVSALSKNKLDQMTKSETHQGVVAECEQAKPLHEDDLERLLDGLTENPFLLILDGVQDPHNLGACFRSAEASGVHAVIVPKDKSVGMTATVSKVASGAAEVVPFIQVTNLARTMRALKERGIWIFGAAGEAEKNLYQSNFNLPLALALGAEGEGLRRLTREHCDELLKIPMQGSVSSLNVSVATGIFLFEALRQKLKN